MSKDNAEMKAPPQILTAVQRDSLKLCLNIYAMVHSYAIQNQSGTYSISRVLNKCVETLQKFVGGCMTHDVVRVVGIVSNRAKCVPSVCQITY